MNKSRYGFKLGVNLGIRTYDELKDAAYHLDVTINSLVRQILGEWVIERRLKNASPSPDNSRTSPEK